jgi:hypothetical protein
VGTADPPPACPTCGSTDPRLRAKVLECRDAWHDRVVTSRSTPRDWIVDGIEVGNVVAASDPRVNPGGTTDFEIDPRLHAPRIARTLMEGPGNRTRVRGCACGAWPTSPEAYADHVGWPVEAVRALLDLIGIADDLLSYPETMRREDVWQQINRCLEVRR